MIGIHIPFTEKERAKKLDLKKIKCSKCDGYYEIREGKYGAFGGCSNFPKCKSTLNFHQLIYEYFKKYGYKIYRWERECWRCSQKSDIYSYYLLYDLQRSYPFFNNLFGIGLGDLPSLDNYMCKAFEKVSLSYSHTVSDYYVANHCQHCGALQGYNYVVDDPHEIMGDLLIEKDMEKYLFTTIPFNYVNTSLSEIKDCFEGISNIFLPEE